MTVTCEYFVLIHWVGAHANPKMKTYHKMLELIRIHYSTKLLIYLKAIYLILQEIVVWGWTGP